MKVIFNSENVAYSRGTVGNKQVAIDAVNRMSDSNFFDRTEPFMTMIELAEQHSDIPNVIYGAVIRAVSGSVISVGDYPITQNINGEYPKIYAINNDNEGVDIEFQIVVKTHGNPPHVRGYKLFDVYGIKID